MSFFDEIIQGHSTTAMDNFLSERKLGDAHTTSVRALTDRGREKASLKLPVKAGTRVCFKVNIGSVLTYDDFPDPAVHGTVVTVRSAHGDTTAFNDRVFVLWDDGKCRPIMAEHLRWTAKSKQAQSVRMVVSDLGDLTSFFTPFGSNGDELVHRATKDLWALKKDGEQMVIERLFKETGEPLKV